MNVAEIKTELDKFEISYEGDMNKPGLQALLDTELTKRAGGNSDLELDDDLLGDDLEIEVEPEMSDDERAERLEAAQAHLAEGEAHRAEFDAGLEAARKDVAKYLPNTKQAKLSDCVNQMQSSVKADSAVQSEMAKLTARFKEEAEQILSGDDE